MDYPRDSALTFLFSTYKRTAGIAFAAILIIAIPVTLALLGQQQDVRQRASSNISSNGLCQVRPACLDGSPPCAMPETGNYCPSTGDDKIVSGPYKWVGKCIFGCEGEIEHFMNITQRNANGEFAGTGYYLANPAAITWDITGRQDQEGSFSYIMTYTGDYAGYVASGSGKVENSKNLTGDVSTSQGQKATFIASPSSCRPLPPGCVLTSNPYGSPVCPETVPSTEITDKPANQLWCPARNLSCTDDSDCISDERCETIATIGGLPDENGSEGVPTSEFKQCVKGDEKPQVCTGNNRCLAGEICQKNTIIGEDDFTTPENESVQIDYKMCVPKSCNTQADCPTGSSCKVIGATGAIDGSEIKQCLPDGGLKIPGNASTLDLNDDGRVDTKDLNVMYSSFSRRQGD